MKIFPPSAPPPMHAPLYWPSNFCSSLWTSHRLFFKISCEIQRTSKQDLLSRHLQFLKSSNFTHPPCLRTAYCVKGGAQRKNVLRFHKSWLIKMAYFLWHLRQPPPPPLPPTKWVKIKKLFTVLMWETDYFYHWGACQLLEFCPGIVALVERAHS